MCGIVGALSAAEIDPARIVSMHDQLVHRGPDGAGVWLAPDRRVCLGHRRLAIIDLRPEANQPFLSADGRLAITFNGEIYNFQDLRRELIDRGVTFRTRSDTEVLLEAFRQWGEGCLERLSGMFAFAIWDNQNRRLFCARDRIGEKPFYYVVAGGSFVFASELKALLMWPEWRRELNYPAVIDYLSFGFVPDPKSIWEGCLKLPPGHWMSVELPLDRAPVVHEPVAYWDMEFDPDHGVNDWGPRILATLQSASAEMAFADVPVGAFLSGGVDSSSVTAALSKAGRSVTAFTVGFAEQGYDERPWARQVSQLFGVPHAEKVIDADDLAPVFESLLWHYDEPFNDYSYLPTFYLCREARSRITVALSGDGGDELFAGYTKYRRLGMRQDLERMVPTQVVRPLLGRAAALLPERSGLRRRLSSHGLDTPAVMLEMLTTGFSLTALRQAARGRLAEALRHYTPFDAIGPLLDKAPPRDVGLLNAMRYLDLKLTLAGDILVKVDRASMAVSLEVRPVYLHRDLLALAARIPPELLADRAQSKKLLKSALRAWLPDSILYRRKMGFALPLGDWLGGRLASVVPDNLEGRPLAELLDGGLLGALRQHHSRGHGDFTARIHSLFFFDRWLTTWA